MIFLPAWGLMSGMWTMYGARVRFIGLSIRFKRKKWNGWSSSFKSPIRKKNFHKIHQGSHHLDSIPHGKTYLITIEVNSYSKIKRKTLSTPSLTTTMKKRKSNRNEQSIHQFINLLSFFWILFALIIWLLHFFYLLKIKKIKKRKKKKKQSKRLIIEWRRDKLK